MGKSNRSMALLVGLMAAVIGSRPISFAQAQEGGSEGGSIGGSISAPAAPAGGGGAATKSRRALSVRVAPRRVAREPHQAPRQRAAAVRSGGGGSASNFDGAWGISVSSACASGNGQILISGGHISGQNVSGSVSPGGAVRTVGTSQGMSTSGSGHLSGASGSGTFRRADGCAGSWSAYRM